MHTGLKSPLSLGSTDFSALRAAGEIYVDKTELLYELARERSKIFLSRPRRFGKSLLISTFESLFSYGLRDFDGLAIDKCWKDTGAYTIVKLDFSAVKDFSTAEEFEKWFNQYLLDYLEVHNYQSPIKNTTEGFRVFSAWLRVQPTNSVVLLIDEYDAPLTSCLDDPELFRKVQAHLSRLYSVIKECEGKLRFFLMTGITKFTNTGIFSAFNIIEDISLDPRYGTLLGYTENEITSCFTPHIKEAAEVLGISIQEVISRMRIWYDGFSFDEKAATHVYCPWSVLNFLKKPARGFENYWYSSGGKPKVLLKYLNGHSLGSIDSFDKPASVTKDDLSASREYNSISLSVLLTQAGYLTIKSLLNSEEFEIGYPNSEVRLSMVRLYADELLRGVNRLEAGVSVLANKLDTEDLPTVVTYFNKVFNAIDYNRYPIENEASCRSHLQVLLMGGAMVPDVEKHTALGRSDLEVRTANRLWVFEIKFAKCTREVEPLLAQAVTQIQKRRYGMDFDTKEVIRAALVFNAESRQFDAFEEAAELSFAKVSGRG